MNKRIPAAADERSPPQKLWTYEVASAGFLEIREVEAAARGCWTVERDVLDGPEQQEHAEQEAEVADAIDDECLATGRRERVVLEPEPDQQERAQSRRLPSR